jgi:3-deoxy-manno-octulosonate cytidylyltransferase (CMP-KDO synthetase)
MADFHKKVLGVIPARLGSTRIPEKMLKDLAGKPLIQRTVERTLRAKSLDAIVVTTDSERIAEVVRSLGVPVIMSPSELPTGTDRVAYAVQQFLDFTPDIVVNVWGDEPLYPAEAIDRCVALLLEDESLHVAGLADRIEDMGMLHEPSIVQVLMDKNDNALFFTRAAVPFRHHKDAPFHDYHVIGAMAMRRSFLTEFLSLPRTPIECVEGVEQMRILEHGYRMRMVKGHFRNLGVNTIEELERVRAIFEREPVTSEETHERSRA